MDVTSASRQYLGRFSLVAAASIAAWLAAVSPTQADGKASLRDRLRDRVGMLRDIRHDRPEHHPAQIKSLDLVYYRARTDEDAERLQVALPGPDEVQRFVGSRDRMNGEALQILDDLFGAEQRLKALAVRDTDGDGLADYRISDYFGKFSEGDLDVDGDGVRNILDSHPYDRARGGRDTDGDGTPDEGFADDNANGLPDHLDWATSGGHDPELVAIQAGLHKDFHIALVERDAAFDLPLARAVDDVIRRVYGRRIVPRSGLPTLRTVAVEHTALLNAELADEAGADMNAQVLFNSQSLIIYDSGREVSDPLGLLGLLAHEIGHAWHMSLDWDTEHPQRENARNDFPVPVFVKTIEPFGWTRTGYFDGELKDELAVRPQFLYTGLSEPEFQFRGATAEDWARWLDEIYAVIGAREDYLEDDRFARQGVVGDYSLTTPYEWYSDNALAYLLVTLEEAALAGLEPGPAAEARKRITIALRTVWPGFNHRNIATDVREYFGATIPIVPADRDELARRYLQPILAGPPVPSSPQ